MVGKFGDEEWEDVGLMPGALAEEWGTVGDKTLK